MKTKDLLLIVGLMNYWSKIVWNVQRYRKQNYRMEKDKADYPNVIVGCKYLNYRKYGRSAHSNFPQLNRKENLNLHKRIENAVEEALKNKTQKDNWYNKTCAEDHAASECLFSCEKNNKKLPDSLSDLEFTIALRPRTGGMINYCNTCKLVFGL